MVGDAGKVHSPACKLDEEQRIHALQEDRVDGEAVAGDDPSSLLAQERPPARRGASRRRVKAVGAQHPPDRAGRHPNAKPQQLAVDALVAPPRVLAGKPHDQPLHLVSDRRPSLAGGRVGPAPGHHAPMPAQQRLRRDQEHRPARRGSSRLNAASSGRSLGCRRGRGCWRRSTASSWRNTRISISLACADRQQSRTSSRLRRSAR
jgi:hypothetical protein